MAANPTEATACAECGAPRTFSRRCHACGALFPGQVAAVGTAPPSAASADPAAPAAGAPAANPAARVPSAAAAPAPPGPPSAEIAEVAQKFSGNMPFVELRQGKIDLLVGYRTSRDGVSAEDAAAADANVEVKAYIMDMNYEVVREVSMSGPAGAIGIQMEAAHKKKSGVLRGDVIEEVSATSDADYNFADAAAYAVRAGIKTPEYSDRQEYGTKESYMLFVVLQPRAADKARPLEWVSCAISLPAKKKDEPRAVPDFFSMDAAALGGCTGCIPGYFFFHVTNDVFSGAATEVYELRMPLHAAGEATGQIQTFMRAEFPTRAADTRTFVVPDTHFAVGLGWKNDHMKSRHGGDRAKFGYMNNVDMDLSCLIADTNGKIVDVVCFNRLCNASESIRHSGDKGQCGSPFSYGAGRGDSEQIEVDLDRVPANVSKLFFLQTQYQNYQLDVESYVRVMLGTAKHTVRLMDTGGSRRLPSTFVFYLEKIGSQWHYRQMDWVVAMKPIGQVQTWADVVIPLQTYLDAGMGKLPETNDAIFSDHTPALPLRHEMPMPAPAVVEEKFLIRDPASIRLVPEETKILAVKVCGAVNLLGADKDGKSDPWVKMSLVGHTGMLSHHGSTATVNNTCHPRFPQGHDETHFDGITKDDVVKFEVFDKDTLTSDPLGHASFTVPETHVRGPIMLHLTGTGPKGVAATGFLIVKFAWMNEYHSPSTQDGKHKPSSYKWGSKHPSCLAIHPEGGKCEHAPERPCYMLHAGAMFSRELEGGHVPYSL